MRNRSSVSLRSIWLAVTVVVALLVISGCGTGTAAPVVTGPTVTITASPTQVAGGASTTLTVTATGASSVVITDNTDSNKYPLPASGGTQKVTPTATTIYTVAATGSGGTNTATVTVTVTGPTITLTANPLAVAAGGTTTLTATASGATSVVITDNVDANSYTLTPTGGTQVVTVNATTTYTATAKGAGGTTSASVTVNLKPSVTITATPPRIITGGSSTLTVTAIAATSVVITDNVDTTSYTLTATGGTQKVTPAATTIYTATATGVGGTATATVTVTVGTTGTIASVNHVLFMMQENRTFDTYFGMLNPYRVKNGFNVGDDGVTYNVDGIDDKLSTTNVNDEGVSFPLFHTISSCLDDMTSAWEESYGDVSRYDFSTTRSMLMDGFVHIAENYAKSGSGDGSFTDTAGQRAMAYYQDTSTTNTPELNYYYYMASQFAVSDRWFSPVSSKSTPNRIATMTGGTTQGLVKDPFVDDKFTTTLTTKTIFEQLDGATPLVSWKIYYSETQNGCDVSNDECNPGSPSLYPVTTFSDFGYSGKYVYTNPTHAACVFPTVSSLTAVNDASNAFCIDPTHIAPLSQLYTDMANGTLPSFGYIEAAYGVNDEHPGSGQSIFQGQARIATILGNFMNSKSWSNADTIFFLSYDEGGGPYDHVPPVPGHSNDKTNMANMALPTGVTIPDISTIAVNPDTLEPCVPAGGTPTVNCDLKAGEPGATSTDAAAVQGFAAQLGFRLPNLVISPFTRRHYVSHIPMDHTAVIKFVENRFMGPTAHLTARDAVQPDLTDFFDFTGIPWLTPPPMTSIPTPPAQGGTCTPTKMQ